MLFVDAPLFETALAGYRAFPEDKQVSTRFLTLLPRIIFLAAIAPVVQAQTSQNVSLPLPTKPTQTVPVPRPEETMVVLGSATPEPLAESPRAVLSLPLTEQGLVPATPLDPLRRDASVFLEQRGAGGAQTDITLRGGGFAQTLVLLNGFRINDSQAAHHNLDLPVPLEAMDSIQVLHGAGSTLHGTDALSGVVDFLTVAPQRALIQITSGAGSFGANEESMLGQLVQPRWSARLTGSHNLSTGFIADRDYRNQTASEEDWANSKLGLTDVLIAGSDRAFGADQFYGPYPSWERTKGWFAGIRQELGSRTQAAFGYRRHTDEYVLIRDNPSVYENNHEDTSWQASLRRTESLKTSSVLLLGIEADGDTIQSNNLGDHARNRAAGYADLDIKPQTSRWSLSVGAREEGFSGGRMVFAPHLAGLFRVTDGLKLHASGGYGFRIPTYTDLYYSDPTTIGNAALKPESAWSGDAGVDWVLGAKIELSATGFYTRQHDAIDYVRASEADKWQSANLSRLRFGGVESALTWVPARSETIRISWTALAGAQSALHGLQSQYIFNYPVENVHADWTAVLGKHFVVRNQVQIAQRYQQTAYPVWDVTLTDPAGLAFRSHAETGMSVRPYLRLANLANTGYQEIQDVAMPGRSITGGISIRIGK